MSEYHKTYSSDGLIEDTPRLIDVNNMITKFGGAINPQMPISQPQQESREDILAAATPARPDMPKNPWF